MPKTIIIITNDKIVIETESEVINQKGLTASEIAHVNQEAARMTATPVKTPIVESTGKNTDDNAADYVIDKDTITKVKHSEDEVWHEPKHSKGLINKATVPNKKLKAKLEKKLGTKNCIICKNSFIATRSYRKLCGENECQKEHQRRYARKYWAKMNGEAAEKEEKPEGDVDWCKHCKAYTTHDTMHHFKLEGAADEVPPEKPEVQISEEKQPESELRSACHNAKVEKKINRNGKTTQICVSCGHQCKVNEFLTGYEKSQADIDEAIHQFKPIIPGTPGYSNSDQAKKDKK